MPANIDWTKPIETVPDERNPAPVPCEYGGRTGRWYDVYIRGDWFTESGVNQRDYDSGQPWYYGVDGDPNYDRLPHIRNVEAL